MGAENNTTFKNNHTFVCTFKCKYKKYVKYNFLWIFSMLII